MKISFHRDLSFLCNCSPFLYPLCAWYVTPHRSCPTTLYLNFYIYTDNSNTHKTHPYTKDWTCCTQSSLWQHTNRASVSQATHIQPEGETQTWPESLRDWTTDTRSSNSTVQIKKEIWPIRNFVWSLIIVASVKNPLYYSDNEFTEPEQTKRNVLTRQFRVFEAEFMNRLLFRSTATCRQLQ